MGFMNGDLDPAVAAAFRRLSDAADRLNTVRIRAERKAYPRLDDPVEVDTGLMYRLAARPQASDALRRYAERVIAGECEWRDIEYRALPLPPEVGELKADPYFVWTWTRTPFEDEEEDEESWGPPKTWLV